MVHRNNLRAMKQGEDEAFRNYVARLKETAIDCNFSLKCTADLCDSQVCYTEEMIRDQAVYGMNCSDTQAKILAMGSDLLPLASVIQKAEAEEQALNYLPSLRMWKYRESQQITKPYLTQMSEGSW